MRDSEELRIFEELSNPMRLETLNLLRFESMKISQIAKKLKSTIQGLQRHISRLAEAGLIEKQVDGRLSLTPIGQITLQQIPSFQFLAKHAKYFLIHTFTGVPSQLLFRIGELNNSELITDPMKGWQKARDMAINAKEFVYSATITMPNEMFDVAKNNFPLGTNYKILFGENSYVPKGYYEYPSRKFWIRSEKNDQVEERFVKHLPITVFVSESEAHVQFENKKLGEPDTLGFFVSKDKIFRSWCMDLFNHYWETVPKIDKFRIHGR